MSCPSIKTEKSTTLIYENDRFTYPRIIIKNENKSISVIKFN